MDLKSVASAGPAQNQDMNQPQKPGILLVDDKPNNLLALEKLLKGPEINIFKAQSGNDALALILEHDFAVILLDVQMPDMDGFETAELIRGNNETSSIPIIFVTAINKEQRHVFRGYEAGAVDYLFKPLDPDILKSKVKTFLELYNQKTTIKIANSALEQANQKILDQQKSVIEEERLKVLLQMAGATAHELRQPLTVLLGNIELIRDYAGDSENREYLLKQIEDAGQRISDIVDKIQIIRRDETRLYAGETHIINFDQEIRILYAEDSDIDYQKINSIFADDNRISLSRTKGIKESIEILKQQKIDIVFLDFLLPDGDGFEFLTEMEKQDISVPVVVISGQGDEVIAARTIQAGAFDYISKARLDTATLKNTISATLEKARLMRETKIVSKKIVDMAVRDDLTGLCNRRNFNEVVEIEVKKAKADDSDMALCMMDLDHFKQVNDTYGHQAGDMVLSETGRLLKECFRTEDLAFRYGGEEFSVILPRTQADTAKSACERFKKALAQKQFACKGTNFKMTVSIGIAQIDEAGLTTPFQIVNMADHALYMAKQKGRNRVETISRDCFIGHYPQTTFPASPISKT